MKSAFSMDASHQQERSAVWAHLSQDELKLNIRRSKQQNTDIKKSGYRVVLTLRTPGDSHLTEQGNKDKMPDARFNQQREATDREELKCQTAQPNTAQSSGKLTPTYRGALSTSIGHPDA
jgi:hypothetical protein